MWLLDVNLPNGLAGLLHGFGISCDTAARRHWRDLTNGALADAAFREGFRVILTRDRLFGMSARRVLAALPGLAIVVVTLPQAREEAYLAELEMQWRRKPIEPVAGAVVEWP
jgi:predicted nuclease of predicted toxin-antitoxin system